MLASLCGRVLNKKGNVLVSKKTHLGIHHFSALLSTRSFASKPSPEANKEVQRSLVVSYLINSCGLSPESADSASRKVKFQTLDNPESVLNVFRNHGFSQTQISKIIWVLPSVLVINVEKILLPKMEFFRSREISGTELGNALSSNPNLLIASLENTLIPCFDLLKTTAYLDDRKVFKALNRFRFFRTSNIDATLAPNVALLEELGVPRSSISYLVTHFPSVVLVDHDVFVKAVEEVKKMGFEPFKIVFVHAIRVIYNMTESKWESKFEGFRKWGWSKDETLAAFRKQPLCLAMSDEKVMRTMEFLVNEMGFPSKELVVYPKILFYSLEKRIKPRCLVVRVLMLKGLLQKDPNLNNVLNLMEKRFLEKFVTKFQESVPQLLNLYKGKVNLLDIGIKSMQIHP